MKVLMPWVRCMSPHNHAGHIAQHIDHHYVAQAADIVKACCHQHNVPATGELSRCEVPHAFSSSAQSLLEVMTITY